MAKTQTEQEGKSQQQLTEEPKVKQVTFLEAEDGKPETGPKKVRKRTKGIMNKLRSQVEFYFGDANLNKDRFMKQQTDSNPEGYVPISVFINFAMIKALTTDGDLLVKALKLSEMLQVSEDGTKVRRITPIKYFTPEEVDARTVYVEGFHKFTSREWITQMFSKCGNVTYVSLPRFKTSKEIKGYAFVEFETPEEAARAVEKLNCVPDKLDERPEDRVAASVKQSKNLTHWKKRASKEGVDPTEAESTFKEGVKQGEEDGPKEGAKTKSKRKKKKNRPSVSQVEGSTVDSTTVPKTDITSTTSMKDESKENTLKPEASIEGEDTKIKKSKKSKKKRKRKNTLPKQTSEEATFAVSQKAEDAESSEPKSKRSDKSGEASSTAAVEMKKDEDSDHQGSRKRKQPADETPDHNSAKVPRIDLNPGEGSKKTDEKEGVKEFAGYRSVSQEDSKPVSELTHLSMGGEDAGRDSESQKSSHKKRKKQGVDSSENTGQEENQPAPDTLTGATSEGDGSEKPSETQKSISKKRKPDTVDASQEKPSKVKKPKENKQGGHSRKSTEQGPDTAAGEGRKRKRKSMEGVDDGSSRKRKKYSTGSDAKVASETEEQERKTKRHRRHKPPEPAIRLRVMSKEKWTQLKEEYLGQQKISMRKLKDQVRETALKKKEQAKNTQNNGQDGKGGHPPPEFVSNVILEVRSDGALCLQTIKADIPPAVQVAYVDIRPGMTEGYIRCKDAASASQLLKNGLRGLSLSQVEGEAELQYWNKLVTDRQAKLSNTKRRKRRGKLKILQRAQNPHEDTAQRQHLIFADDDAEGTMDVAHNLDGMQDDFNAYSYKRSIPAPSPSTGANDSSMIHSDDEQFEVLYG